MKTTLALTLFLNLSFSLAAEDTPVLITIPPEKPVKKELPPDVIAATKTFFDSLDEKPFRLHIRTRSEVYRENEGAALTWLIQSVINLDRQVRNPVAGVTLRKGKPTDETVARYLKYAAGDRVKLDPTKTYIHIKYEGMACPETHCIIDPAGPTLLLYWTDGGG